MYILSVLSQWCFNFSDTIIKYVPICCSPYTCCVCTICPVMTCDWWWVIVKYFPDKRITVYKLWVHYALCYMLHSLQFIDRYVFIDTICSSTLQFLNICIATMVNRGISREHAHKICYPPVHPFFFFFIFFYKL